MLYIKLSSVYVHYDGNHNYPTLKDLLKKNNSSEDGMVSRMQLWLFSNLKFFFKRYTLPLFSFISTRLNYAIKGREIWHNVLSKN